MNNYQKKSVGDVEYENDDYEAVGIYEDNDVNDSLQLQGVSLSQKSLPNDDRNVIANLEI